MRDPRKDYYSVQKGSKTWQSKELRYKDLKKKGVVIEVN